MGGEAARALVDDYVTAWRGRDLARLGLLFADDYSVNGSRVGREGVTASVSMLHDALSDLSLDVHDVLADGDRVAVRWSVSGSHTGDLAGISATGKPVRIDGINIYRVAGGVFVANDEQTNLPDVVHQLAGADGAGRGRRRG